jgi:translation initiation factor 5B
MKEDKRIRQPIVSVLGHVDHGKTLLLDTIRGTRVQAGEAGGITQHVGASSIPIDTIRKICGPLMDRIGAEVTIPGLLFIDTPGHEAFTTLRKRGGSVADLAILVIDINEGFQPQTDESLTFLKEFKTPFVVAATKIDRIAGWNPKKGSFLKNLASQRDDVKDELERKVYSIVAQLAERGINAERFDRFEKIEDFTKSIAIVPCSGLKGEGVPELLMVLTGLAQQFLKNKLGVSDTGRGTVLELKEVRGFGPTVDVIIYDGTVRKNDYIVIGGKKPIITKVKALLRPRPLKELRVEKQFESVDAVSAATGIKIAAPNLSGVIAGSPIVAVKSEGDVDTAKKEVQKEVEEVEFEKDIQGIIVKADTLGSLEALVKMMQSEDIPIRKAEVGSVNKQDVIEAANVKDKLKRVVLAFNVHSFADADTMAKDTKIKIFSNNIIYKLMEDYKDWRLHRKEREIEEKLSSVQRPVKLKLLKGCIFHAAKPCIVGVEVTGYLKTGVKLRNESGKEIGKVKGIQKEGKSIDEAKTGNKVAISMDEPVAGRTINEGDVLVSALTESDKKTLQEVYDKLTVDEKLLLQEL